jgi:hypothetical protein
VKVGAFPVEIAVQPAGAAAAAFLVTGFAILDAQLYQRCVMLSSGKPLHVAEVEDI